MKVFTFHFLGMQGIIPQMHFQFSPDERLQKEEWFNPITQRRLFLLDNSFVYNKYIYIYTQLLINTTEINYQAEIEKNTVGCLLPALFFGHHFRVRGNIPGRSKAPQSSQLLEELKQSSPSFLRFLLGKHVLPFT